MFMHNRILIDRGRVGRGLPSSNFTSALALAMPEFKGISLFETLVMSTVGAETGQGEVHSAVELQFWLDDFKGLGALLIALTLALLR